MRQLFYVILLLASLQSLSQQPSQRNKQVQQVDTANLDLKKFAENIYGNEADDYERAKKILYWLSSNFEWKATDYQTRTVKQIMARGGGNCFELAKVYIEIIKNVGITYRSMCEINIHPYTPRRQESAADMVAQKGNSYSVFGLQHNDHRWVEIYDKKNDAWQPADPSMGVIGLKDWIKARVWFGERKTIDTAITNEMIVPFAIFITANNKGPQESRTNFYLIESFNKFYDSKLETLPEWKEWKASVTALTDPSMNAFLGKVNLHNYKTEIGTLATIYERLKTSYRLTYGNQ